MSLGVQPAGIAEGGVLHAQLCGAGVHLLHKGGLAAAHQLCHCHRRIVGGGHTDGFEHLVQRELLPGLQPDLTAAHVVGVLADRHGSVHGQPPGVHRFKGEQQGHHLSNGSDGHGLVGIHLIKHRAAGLVDEHRRAAGQGKLRRGDRQGLHCRFCLRLHRRLDAQPFALRRTKGQRKQPEADHPRAQQRQISPFHSSYLPAQTLFLQCMPPLLQVCRWAICSVFVREFSAYLQSVNTSVAKRLILRYAMTNRRSPVFWICIDFILEGFL